MGRVVDWEQRSFNFDDPPRTIQERFEAFHAKHPEVYAYMVSLCFELRRRGFKHYGVRPLYERARWHFQIEKDLGEEFKLNDHYISRYARLIMHNYPDEFGEFFELRELKTA